MSIEADLIAGASEVIGIMGADFTLQDPDGSNARSVRAAVVKPREEAIINAYGNEVSVAYMLEQSIRPKKHDVLVSATRRWTVISDHAIEANGAIVVHKLVVKE